MTLTKACIVEKICASTSLNKKRSAKVFETLLEIMKRTLETREEIVIRRFGKFSVKNNNGRKGNNPSTSEKFMLGVMRVVIFRSSSALIKKINEGSGQS
jgi:integration host factor subunit alpha